MRHLAAGEFAEAVRALTARLVAVNGKVRRVVEPEARGNAVHGDLEVGAFVAARDGRDHALGLGNAGGVSRRRVDGRQQQRRACDQGDRSQTFAWMFQVSPPCEKPCFTGRSPLRLRRRARR